MSSKFLTSRINNITLKKENPEPMVLELNINIMEEANLKDYQKVTILHKKSGKIFITYVKSCLSGDISFQSPGVEVGDQIELLAFSYIDEKDLGSMESVHLYLDDNNQITKIIKGKI